jgi:hypothetical protein
MSWYDITLTMSSEIPQQSSTTYSWLVPFLVVIVGWVLSLGPRYWDRRTVLRDHSRLMIAYLLAFREEVETGIEILEANEKKSKEIIMAGSYNSTELPNTIWVGMHTIPKEAILQLIAVTRNLQVEPGELKPWQSISHLKNYFVFVTGNYNTLIHKGGPEAVWKMLHQKVDPYPDSARKILRMINLSIAELNKSIGEPVEPKD